MSDDIEQLSRHTNRLKSDDKIDGNMSFDPKSSNKNVVDDEKEIIVDRKETFKFDDNHQMVNKSFYVFIFM